MKGHTLISALAAAVVMMLLPSPGADGQNHVRKAMRKARERQEALARMNNEAERSGVTKSAYMMFAVENGDTVYFDSIDPVWVFAKGKKNSTDWRKYYRLVYNFARVYPYAKAAKRLDQIADSTIAAEGMGRLKKEKYVAGIQKQLFTDFEGALRGLTISQGAVLLKLIDRETSKSSYNIIKEYKSGIAAGFWQGIAKMFDNSLKTSYDPEGEDKELEELVKKWEDGTFPALYYSIYWEDPPQVKVPERYR